MSRNGLFIEYCAKDFLDGTIQLGAFEELAYRRICDMIYATNNNLINDDESLAWSTKTGGRWPQVKQTLLALGKIQVEGQRLLNDRCTLVLAKTAKKIEQKRGAGKASADARKAKLLDQLGSRVTDVDIAVATDEQRQDQRTHLTTEPSKEAAATGEKPTWMIVGHKVIDMMDVATDPRWFGNASPAEVWLKWGADPDLDIYPTVETCLRRHLAKGRGPPKSLNFFDDAISEALANRQRPRPEVNHANGTRTAKPAKPTQESDRRIMLETLGLGAGRHGLVDDPDAAGTVLEGEYRRSH